MAIERKITSDGTQTHCSACKLPFYEDLSLSTAPQDTCQCDFETPPKPYPGTDIPTIPPVACECPFCPVCKRLQEENEKLKTSICPLKGELREVKDRVLYKNKAAMANAEAEFLKIEVRKYQKALDIAKEFIIHRELRGTADQRMDMINKALK